MRRYRRTVAAVFAAGALAISTPGLAAGQEDQQAPPASKTHAEVVAQSAQGRENLDPSEEGLGDNNIDNDAGATWEPTDDPESEVTPGQMRSDSEEIPGGFTKEEADKAETQEAEEQAAAGGEVGVQANPTNCRTYWPSPFKVCGKIREKYDAMGGPTSFLTWPRSDELGVPDGQGRRNEFVNGFIYWHASTGAHPISTHFSLAYDRNGWEAGGLGYPTSDEFATPKGDARKQEFQNGAIYGSPAGLAAVEGRIYDKYVSDGASNGKMGLPIADEAGSSDGVGRFSTFTGGNIYWTPQQGAHSIQDFALLYWGANGFEKSEYGYPTSDTYVDDEGIVRQSFQHKELNLFDLIDGDETVQVGNKKMGAGLAKIIAEYFEGDWAIPDATLAQGEQGPEISPFDTTVVIPVPDNYEYYGENSGNARHDYCTKSPDQFASVPGWDNADFSGPCARHDLCYDRVDKGVTTQNECDAQLYTDLQTTCDTVYASSWDPNRPSCFDRAMIYYQQVQGAEHHFDNGNE